MTKTKKAKKTEKAKKWKIFPDRPASQAGNEYAYQKTRLERGKCLMCGSDRKGGDDFYCRKHVKVKAAIEKKRWAAKLKRGSCNFCAKAKMKDSPYCAKHKVYMKAYRKAYYDKHKKKGGGLEK